MEQSSRPFRGITSGFMGEGEVGNMPNLLLRFMIFLLIESQTCKYGLMRTPVRKR